MTRNVVLSTRHQGSGAVVDERDFGASVAQQQRASWTQRNAAHRDERPVGQLERGEPVVVLFAVVKVVRRASDDFDVAEPVHRHRGNAPAGEQDVGPLDQRPKVCGCDRQQGDAREKGRPPKTCSAACRLRDDALGGKQRQGTRDVKACQLGGSAHGRHVGAKLAAGPDEGQRAQRAVGMLAVDAVGQGANDAPWLAQSPAFGHTPSHRADRAGGDGCRRGRTRSPRALACDEERHDPRKRYEREGSTKP
jgi:hypothetical protein